jgi:hypothetical protein
MTYWTVVGYYTDNDQPWMAWAGGETAVAAAMVAVMKLDTPVDEIAVVEVIKGKRKGYLGNEAVASMAELRDLRKKELQACRKPTKS